MEKILKLSEREYFMEITVCPRCHKPVDMTDYRAIGLLGGMNTVFRCKNCRYRGLPIVLSDEE